MITLRCACGNQRSSVNLGGPVDIADFLREAIRGGWRRIDEEQTNLIPSLDSTEIFLSGQCENCTAVELHDRAKKVA